MSKSKYYAETYRALRPAALFIFILCPLIAILMIYVTDWINSMSPDELVNAEVLFYGSIYLFFALVILISIVACKTKVNGDKNREKSEKEIIDALVRQALMKYLSQFPDKNKQEFLNYLAQCPEEKRQEILLKIVMEYGISENRK